MTLGTGRGARTVRNTALLAFAASMAAFIFAVPGEAHLLATLGGPLVGPGLLVLLVPAASYVQSKDKRWIAAHAILTLLVMATFNASLLSTEQLLVTFAGAGAFLLYAELAYMGLEFSGLQARIKSKVTKSGGRSRGVLDLDEVEGRLATSLRQPLLSAFVLVAAGLYVVRPMISGLSPAIGASIELRSLYGALFGAGVVLAVLTLGRVFGLSFRVKGRLPRRAT
ncbi:MAG: hypothetical protein HY556_10970 [Euryarchaeota archaeon]|nr:hypothetical protein [Euryarchaeota archaeon]